MTKTEAAEIIADNIGAHYTRNDLDDRDLTWVGGPSRLAIAEAISRMTHESVPGSYAHRAALTRPSDRTIVQAIRRAAGI